MDTLFEDFPASMNDLRFDHHSQFSVLAGDRRLREVLDLPGEPSPTSGSSSEGEAYSPTDLPAGDFSDAVILKYISEMLMEEQDLESQPCMLRDCLGLQATEKSLYDVIGQKYPSFRNPCDQTGVSPAKRNQRPESGEEEEWRSSKQSAIYGDASEPSEIFDEVLLCKDFGREEGDAGSLCPRNGERADRNARKKSRQRKRNGRSRGQEVVDLWALLTQCAQAVASYDQTTAFQLLTQIRQHSSECGGDTQRLAHYFANGLEARFSAGTPLYNPFGCNGASAADILKAYQVYITACPFKWMSNFYANRSIFKLASQATSLHIIDFGLLYGYQWPCLIQRLSERPGGPPRLRITGVEFPQPGFRPSERVEQTGRRLENYCRRFNVPFTYKVIADKWENVRLEDLAIDRSELTVVNCLYRMKNLPEETVVEEDCPRDTVLRLIRRVEPDLFIHGVVNGTHNAPFFLTRFREALFHFSALFDMFEASLGREDPHRLMFEREVFGRDVMNVVACEGPQRVERPETYKQWHIRNTRAGFRQVGLDQELVSKVKSMVRSNYHKDFVVDEDGKWLLQGWKGRIFHAISCWRPV